jgi:hypothetical protein
MHHRMGGSILASAGAGLWRLGPDMKTTIILMFSGAFAGIVIASFVVPPALAWYTSPGGLPQGAQIQAVVQIPEVIKYATASLIRGQAIGAVIGAAAGLALGIFLGISGRRKPAATASGTTNRNQ